MKTTHKLLLSGIFWLNAALAFSQISFGLSAGMNFAGRTFKGEYSRLLYEANIPSAQVGGIIEYTINSQIAIQSGISLQGKGVKIDKVLSADSRTKTSAWYIQVPLHVIYKFKGFFAGVGPYAAYAVAGKTKFTLNNKTTSEKTSFGDSEGDDELPFDAGLGTQAGVRLNALRVGVGYDLGMRNLAPLAARSGGYGFKNGVITLFANYLFMR